METDSIIIVEGPRNGAGTYSATCISLIKGVPYVVCERGIPSATGSTRQERAITDLGFLPIDDYNRIDQKVYRKAFRAANGGTWCPLARGGVEAVKAAIPPSVFDNPVDPLRQTQEEEGSMIVMLRAYSVPEKAIATALATFRGTEHNGCTWDGEGWIGPEAEPLPLQLLTATSGMIMTAFEHAAMVAKAAAGEGK